MRRRRRRRPTNSSDIPTKANHVLNIILIAIFLIVIRVWHLGIIQHEEKLEESRRPQKRVVVEPAKRGTIRDRFNIPLAINKVQYNAAILYSEIRQIPSVVWKKEGGKRVKEYKRRNYIAELARLLGDELALNQDRIEDLIHSKASLYNNLPFVIKEDISEKEYYHLKMLEKDWLGIQVLCLPKRHYPLGKVAGDIIGYMGAISREQYEAIIQEIKTLEAYLAEMEAGENPPTPLGVLSPDQGECRLQDLIEHAYSINDYVGKTGIEGRFEEQLRGYHGKKSYYSDARGNFLREFPGAKPPLSGQRFLLTISSELQEYAEKLLIQNERIRVPRITGVNNSDQKGLAEKHPWIKGGAIVAMDPYNGDVLALASFPRFDPNDFIASGNPEYRKKKNANIQRWFELESYIGQIWDQARPLARERSDDEKEKIIEEEVWMTWEKYLEFILPKNCAVKEGLDRIKTIGRALDLQKNVDKLLSLTGKVSLYPLFNLMYKAPYHTPHGRRLPAVQQEDLEDILDENAEEILAVKRKLDPYLSKISSNYDKVLLIDLCRLIVDENRISSSLFQEIHNQTLSSYRQMTASAITIEETTKNMTRELFSTYHFKSWREENQKTFLKQKRAEEKAAGKKYAKPYLDLLDQEERKMFNEFWETNRWNLVLAFLSGNINAQQKELTPYFDHLVTWERELMQGAHQEILWNKAYWTIRKGIEGLSPANGIAFLQSIRSFSELNRPLLGRYRHIRRTNNQQLEKNLAAAFYPTYGFGHGRSFSYRQAATQGSIFKLVTSYEALVQKYQQTENGPKNFSTLNPLIIVDDIHKKGKGLYLGYDANGKPIPQLYKGGRMPRSHRSGIGQVDLIKALEVSSNPYFSLLAADHIKNPNDLSNAAKKFSLGCKTGIDLPAEISGRVPYDLEANRDGLYAMSIGQHSLVVTPLQTAVMLAAFANGGKILKPKIVNMIIGKGINHHNSEGKLKKQSLVTVIPTKINSEIFMPEAVRNILINGMHRVMMRSQSSIWGSLSRMYCDYPDAISDFVDLKDQLIGKSSTAESVENIDLDLKLGTSIYNHCWFGGILYDPKKPEKGDTFVFRDQLGKPELIVVVYLQYGAWGKEAGPLAAQVVQKWREIKKANLKDKI